MQMSSKRGIPKAEEAFLLAGVLYLLFAVLGWGLNKISILLVPPAGIFIFALLPGIILKKNGFDLVETFMLHRLRIWQIGILILIGILSFGSFSMVITLFAQLFEEYGYNVKGEEEEIRRFIHGFLSSGGIIGLLIISIIPSISEELFFRGLLLSSFAKSFGKTRALIYTSLFFGAVHANPLQSFATFMLGLVFGAATLVSKSILGGMVCHAVNNLCVVFFMLYIG
jgi:hypothetical protein